MEGKFYPKTLVETKLGLYFISAPISLKVDKELKTIWIDLETKVNLFSIKKFGAFNFPIIRATFGTDSDFKIIMDQKFLKLFEELKSNKSIPELIEIILNPESLGQEQQQIIDFILNKTKNYSDSDKKTLFDFRKFILGLPKYSLSKLLSEKKYSLLFGNLSPEEEIENRTRSEISGFKSFPNVTEKDLEKYFGNIILDFDLIKKTFIGINLPEILLGKIPKKGGIILLDQGGTGKSMIKAGLAKFWKEVLGGEVKEKKTGDISSYVNAAPQLIQTWYRGGVMEGFEDKKAPEIDLVAAAKNNQVPSLLIIDEAEEFILEDKGYNSKRPIEGSTTSLKRFIQDIDKGGVTGAVVTVLIANMSEEEIHQPIVQGSERLKGIYFGPPRKIEQWEKISKIGFRNISFEDKIDLKLIAELVYYHNETLGKFNGKYYEFESLCISPRRFLGYSDDYINIHGSNETDSNDYKGFLNSVREKVLGKKLHFNIFIKNFIFDVLKDKLNSSKLNQSEKDIISKRYDEFLKDSGFKDSTSSKSYTDFGFEKEDFETFLEIFNDLDTQRIMKARTIGQVLGISIIVGNNDSDSFRRLVNKFNSQSQDYIKFNEKICKGKLTISFVRLLYQKIITANPRGKKLDELVSGFDFFEFKNYTNDN